MFIELILWPQTFEARLEVASSRFLDSMNGKKRPSESETRYRGRNKKETKQNKKKTNKNKNKQTNKKKLWRAFLF